MSETGTALSKTEPAAALADQLGLEFVDLDTYQVDLAAAHLVPETFAHRYQAMPIGWHEGRLVLAMANPSNVFAIDDVRTLTGSDVRQVVVTTDALQAALAKYYRRDAEAEHASAEAAASAAPDHDDRLSRVKELADDAPIVRLVDLLITQAISDRASDIHVEPTGEDVRIRYRVDGVLHDVMHSPRNIHAGLVSRLKVLADINIAERRIPQDGRITTKVEGRSVDLRVATLPTVHGEKLVLRILDNSSANLRLSELGFLPGNMERYQVSYSKPYGTILVTGPTGSGKTTTLYATLNALNDPAKNAITVEDPVEYQLKGINQIQVNPKAGLTFVSALRTILRADPDIILIGEIRDRETAGIAVEAALTGHLVLSTIHTNDASTTPNRLIEMGVEPFLVGSALDCVVAQRLARKLCDRCKEAYEGSEDENRLIGLGWEEAMPERLFRAAGCHVCGKTGYIGRFAVHEVLNVTEEIERMIAEHAHAEDIRKAAVADGMATLRQAGLASAVEGLTSVEEVLRVIA